jgi:hypothetical protein
MEKSALQIYQEKSNFLIGFLQETLKSLLISDLIVEVFAYAVLDKRSFVFSNLRGPYEVNSTAHSGLYWDLYCDLDANLSWLTIKEKNQRKYKLLLRIEELSFVGLHNLIKQYTSIPQYKRTTISPFLAKVFSDLNKGKIC